MHVGVDEYEQRLWVGDASKTTCQPQLENIQIKLHLHSMVGRMNVCFVSPVIKADGQNALRTGGEAPVPQSTMHYGVLCHDLNG